MRTLPRPTATIQGHYVPELNGMRVIIDKRNPVRSRVLGRHPLHSPNGPWSMWWFDNRFITED